MVPVKETEETACTWHPRPEQRAAGPGDHGVAQWWHRRLCDLLGEAQIPLPRLPRALVSAGRPGGGGRECRAGWGRGGRPSRDAGGCARPGAEMPCRFCYSCSVTCFRKHRGKAPRPRLSPGPPPRVRRLPRPAGVSGLCPPQARSLRAWSRPTLSDLLGTPLPANASPGFEQSEPFFRSVFSSTCSPFLVSFKKSGSFFAGKGDPAISSLFSSSFGPSCRWLRLTRTFFSKMSC